MKRIVIFGANGGVGKQLTTQALAAGYQVLAMVRNPVNLLIEHANLEIIKADILDPDSYKKHLHPKDVVVSAIGGGMTKPTTLFSDGSKALLQAMQQTGTTRAFFISAAAVEVSPVQPFFVRFFTRYILRKLLSYGYADQLVMEKQIKASTCLYTIIRPPRLTNDVVTGHYRFAVNTYLRNCLKISRADVAHFILEHLSDPEIFRATIEVGY